MDAGKVDREGSSFSGIRCREQQILQRTVVQVGRQRPGQAGLREALQVFRDGRAMDAGNGGGLLLGKSSVKKIDEDIADMAHVDPPVSHMVSLLRNNRLDTLGAAHIEQT